MNPRLLLPALALLTSAAFAASTRLSDQPVLNFRLPTFTPEGHRDWLFRGSEARHVDANRIDVKEMAITVFTGAADNRVETQILSSAARLAPQDQAASGDQTIRVISDRLEATGEQWSYHHKERKILLGKNVRTVIHAEIKNFLQ
jgi:lipopolysaccharide export system protein LptC